MIYDDDGAMYDDRAAVSYACGAGCYDDAVIYDDVAVLYDEPVAICYAGGAMNDDRAVIHYAVGVLHEDSAPCGRLYHTIGVDRQDLSFPFKKPHRTKAGRERRPSLANTRRL